MDSKPTRRLSIAILGLTITSSWGNGHATTYRALMAGLAQRGHHVLFLERDMPWYACRRDLPRPPCGVTCLYSSLAALKNDFIGAIRRADLVIVGSFVPQGTEIGEWILKYASGGLAFYDIDTPVTLAKLARGDHEYITPALLRSYDLYLSFTGGPLLARLENCHGVRRARALYCAVDPERHVFVPSEPLWDLGYMGTYSPDRQAKLDALLCTPARRWRMGRFVVAGPLFPDVIAWPDNVERIEHVAPPDHPAFYGRQRFTLNITRQHMVRAGWSPSVRLFEAAACGTAIISDPWTGIETFFEPGREILVARTPAECLTYLRDLPEDERYHIARRGRTRVLARHTAVHRAIELETYFNEMVSTGAPAARMPGVRDVSAAKP